MSRERVEAALGSEPGNAPPVSAWGHFYDREWDPASLAAATVEARERHGWDWVKLNPRATYFAEAWGAEYERGTGQLDRPRMVRAAVGREGFGAVRELPGTPAAFAEQLRALRQVRERLGRGIPLIHTVFSPLTVAMHLGGRGEAALRAAVRESPDELRVALEAITAALARYAAEAVEAGADGIFFAVSGLAREGSLTRSEYEEFGVAFDLPVLDAAAGAWFNVLHLCGDAVFFDLADRYPVAAVSWAPEPGNPDVPTALTLTSRALMTGVHHVRDMVEGSAEQVEAVARRARAASGHRLLLAPGCSVPPEAPAEAYDALARAAR
jgi:uroporphyrinogen decarboxylase